MVSVEGLALAVLMNAALGLGALLLAHRWLASANAWDRLFAAAAIGWGGLIVGLQGLSAFGRMTLWPALVLAAGVLLAGAVSHVWRAKGRPEHTAKRQRSQTDGQSGNETATQGPSSDATTALHPRRRLLDLLSWLALALTAAAGLYQLGRGLLLPVEPVSDAPIYHLYFAVRWWQAGRLELIAAPFGELAATYFPANGSLWYCWLIMPTGSELPTKVGQWPFWLLGMAVVYALGRQMGAGCRAAVLPAALWGTCSSVLLQGAGLANVDLIFAAWYLVAAYFLVRYGEGVRGQGSGVGGQGATGQGSRIASSVAPGKALICFGLAAGLALGTKAIGLFFLPLLVVPVVILTLRRHQPILNLLLLGLAMLVGCGYWYGRNLVLTGNPLYPAHVELLGRPLFRGWYDPATMTRSGYHAPVGDLGLLADRLLAVVDLRWSWARQVTGLAHVRTAWPTAVILALAALHGACWPAAWLCGLLGACAPSGWRRGAKQGGSSRRLALGLTLLSLAYVAVFWWLMPYQTQQRFLFAAAALGIVPLAGLLEGRRWLQASVALLLSAHLLTPLVGLVAGGSGPEVRPLRSVHLAVPSPHPWHVTPWQFYPTWGDFAPNLAPVWAAVEERSPPEGTPIAYAGTNLPYYLFGRGLRNRAFYVNVNRHAGDLPHHFHLRRLAAGQTALADDPWPQWYRAEPDYDAWLANLRRAAIRLLVVARENQHGRGDVPPGPPPFPIEQQWAQQHPEAFEPLGPLPPPGQREPWAWVYRVK